MAEIKLTLDEYNGLVRAKNAAEEDAAELRKQIIDVKLSDPQVKAITQIARDAMVVAKFAIANLPPEMIKNWPWRTLLDIVDRLPQMPDYTTDDITFAAELRAFSKDCESHEDRRNRKAAL